MVDTICVDLDPAGQKLRLQDLNTVLREQDIRVPGELGTREKDRTIYGTMYQNANKSNLSNKTTNYQ